MTFQFNTVFEYWPMYLEGLRTTIYVTLGSLIFSLILSIPLAMIKITKNKILNFIGFFQSPSFFGSDLSGILCGTAVIWYYFYRNDIRFYYPVHECSSIYFGSAARRYSECGYRSERSSQSTWYQSGGYAERHRTSAGVEGSFSFDDQ